MNDFISTPIMPDPATPPPLRLPKASLNSRLLKWFILLALVLFIVSLFVFWFGKPSFRESGVQLSIEGPNQAAVGDEISYKVKFSNLNKTALSDLRFSFYYPDDSVVIKDGSVGASDKEIFSLGDLSAGQRGEKEFKAFLVGNRGDIKTAKIVLLYEASGLRSEFTKEFSLATTIVSIPVALTLSAPPNLISGQPVNYVLDYRNESGNDISDLRFEFNYPDGFSAGTLTPAADVGSNNIWSIPVLRKNQGARISIQGAIAGREGDAKPILVVLKRKVNGQFIDYEKISSSTTLTNPLLGLEILANDSPNYTAVLEDSLNYTIRYSNNSNFTLTGLTLSVKLEGEMFDFYTVDAKDGLFNSINKTITWNSSSIRDFSVLEPNRRGQVNFKVRVKSYFPSNFMSAQNTFIKVSASLSTPNIPQGVDAQEIATAAGLVTKISTQPTFTQLAYYQDANFGSNGPLPPKVGEKTVFTMHWQLVNPGNGVEDAKVSAILPLGVNWENVTSVGQGQPDVVFNKNTSEVVWNLGVLPQGVGSGTPKYEAIFQISLTPLASQYGNPVTLMKNVKFSGKDGYTKQIVVVPGDNITTDDLTDRPGEGTVE